MKALANDFSWIYIESLVDVNLPKEIEQNISLQLTQADWSGSARQAESS